MRAQGLQGSTASQVDFRQCSVVLGEGAEVTVEIQPALAW